VLNSEVSTSLYVLHSLCIIDSNYTTTTTLQPFPILISPAAVHNTVSPRLFQRSAAYKL